MKLSKILTLGALGLGQYSLDWVAEGYENKVRGYHPTQTRVMDQDLRTAASDLFKARQYMENQLSRSLSRRTIK